VTLTAPVAARPVDLASRGRSVHARRAVVRWAWRLFRREWRQQLLVLALVTVAVAATTVGIALTTGFAKPSQTRIMLGGQRVPSDADIAAVVNAFGPVTVLEQRRIPVPGSVGTFDLRGQDVNAPQSEETLRLLSGHWPTAAGEVALTRKLAATFNLGIGDTWTDAGTAMHVVGLVENPQDFSDQFALVPRGQVGRGATVTLLLNGTPDVRQFRLPSGAPLNIESEGAAAKNAIAAAILALGTIGLLFVGLVAVAGFTVMAQRRQRAMGMLGAIGAGDRDVRLVMLANGAAVGATAALVGAIAGLVGWLAIAPYLETVAGHRIDRFDLPWWAVGGAVMLAVVTSVLAAWWPARAAARVPVVAALSGRPPRPQPAHRFAVLGAVLLAAGPLLLVFSDQRRPVLIIGGTVLTILAVLFVAPLAVQALAVVGRRAPVAVRLALRDLARYQARSGAALGAVTLAVGISAVIVVSAAVQAAGDGPVRRNLPTNQLVVYLSPNGAGRAIPAVTDDQVANVRTQIDAIAAALGTHDVLPLQAAVAPGDIEVGGIEGPGGLVPAAVAKVTRVADGFRATDFTPLYIATPDLLAHYGIDSASVDPDADILTSRTDLTGYQVIAGGPGVMDHPKMQTLPLPAYSSAPQTLITPHAIQTLGLHTVAAGWVVQTPQPLTSAQIGAARKLAAGVGVAIETTTSQQSVTRFRDQVTGVGMLVVLGVLAMTVGLIRSETAGDLRTLAATGATSTTRRTITGATAGALALLGALLGTAGAYVALVAWHRSNLHPLRHVPFLNLLAIVVGLPLVAAVGGWLLAGREPPAIARRPLD
jgi:putative ABC transport system permease protein